MLTDEAMHERMVRGWRGGLPQTVCGFGSTMASTAKVRRWLPDICFRYNIATLADAGAGDMHWINAIRWQRRPTISFYDLIPRNPIVRMLDITKDCMAKADAILCRHCLNHLDRLRIMSALDRFRESGARYLFATQFDHESRDGREFTRLDLRVMLGEPLESTEDGGAEGCLMAIWRL